MDPVGGDLSATFTPTGFFAYSSTPPIVAATVRAAAEAINRTHAAQIVTWEELSVGGKYIIGEICSAIEAAEFFCADVTSINANVLFELGFAIARNKRIWIIRDDTYIDSKREFDQLRMLTTVGYSPYANVENIIKGFFSDQPHLTLDETVFNLSIEPSLGPQEETLVYLKSRHDTEASVQVTRVIQDSHLPLTVDDPRETSVQPLNWYAQKLVAGMALVTHFLSPLRQGYRLHNARYALVSGLARGFGRRTLMLTEQDDLLAPMDYRDSMRYYTIPAEAAKETGAWIEPLVAARRSSPAPTRTYADTIRLASELKGFHLQLGEFVAENEADRLSKYFIETTAYMDVVNGTHTIFVGRKGTGKTSNLIQAVHQIGADVQNLVVVIKPVGYEIEGLARLFAQYKAQDSKGYVIESLWKYMIYSEVAHALSMQMQEAALWQLSGDKEAQELVSMLEDSDSPFSGDFTVRLERVVHSLSKVTSEDRPEAFRRGISEALHSGALGHLRSKLTDVLSRKHRVILLVDNLDKPWTRSADLDNLAEFLLGLLGAATRVGEELRHKAKGRDHVRFTSAIFLRSDIFYRITTVAREPDKLSYSRLRWDDPELLLRVVEERYTASHGPTSDPAEMWHKYFCAQVNGVPTREYLTSRILPRPRDIVFFVKAAVSFAVNRKHDRVEEKDLLDGEKQYSQYAWDSILVENGITIPQLEAVLLEFVGRSAVISEEEAIKAISQGNIDPEKVDAVIEHLIVLTFLGVEVGEDRFVYSDDPKEIKKNTVLANHFIDEKVVQRRYEINPAFRAYLEIREN